MPRMDIHRKVAAKSCDVISLLPPFSFFDYAERSFEHCESMRRIFSLARSANACTLIVEEIPSCGIVEDENLEILSLFPEYALGGLRRLSFWTREMVDGIDSLANGDLAGYAILKCDITSVTERWHVFEAVFLKYQHQHNCVPQTQTYSLAVQEKEFSIRGLLYCQQNALNKACAQVAIRSLLSRLLPQTDVSYRELNRIAASIDPAHVPGNGLTVPQMRRIFEHFGIKYCDVDYSSSPLDASGKNQWQVDLPYQKYAYAGLESGGGALVGFRCTTQDGTEAKHIIPVYGHTFNKDTWAPDANFAYFRIGTKVGYIPSEVWTSSFIGHDDNFGPNFCIPRLYIQKEKVDYILEVFRPGINYSGVQAEVAALLILYSLIGNLDGSKNVWTARLKAACPYQRLVFRAIALARDEYLSHLRSMSDWEDKKESTELCDLLGSKMPDLLWVVEVSTPQLFPANKRKLGEIVFDGTGTIRNPDGSLNHDMFYLARIPGAYMLGGNLDENGVPEFTSIPSYLDSHTALIGL
jgi:hypothetical protein